MYKDYFEPNVIDLVVF